MSSQLRKESLLKWQAAVEAHGQGDIGTAYETMCAMDEQPAPIVFNLAMMHWSLRNLEHAENLLTEAVTKDKHLVVARFQRATVFHYLGRNEDAMKDLQMAVEMLRANYIKYHTLGLDYILCRHYLEYNLAVIRLVLGLKEMSRESYHKSLITKGCMESDADVRELAKDELAVALCDLNDFSIDPCKMNHEHGECPLLRLPGHLLYKPAGLGKQIVRNQKSDEKRDFLKQGQAKVLFSSDANAKAYGPGFRGRLHVEEFMPMAITTKKKMKKKNKAPSTALSDLVKSTGPRVMMFKPTGKHDAPAGGTVAMRQKKGADTVTHRARAQSLFVMSDRQTEIFRQSAPTHRRATDSDILADDDLNIRGDVTPEIIVEDDEQHEQLSNGVSNDQNGKDDSDENTEIIPATTSTLNPPFRKTSVGLAKSVEVLYDPNASPIASPSHISESEFSSSPDDSPPANDHTEINVHTEMTPTTLRDLADMLEHLQGKDKNHRFVVNVHMHPPKSSPR